MRCTLQTGDGRRVPANVFATSQASSKNPGRDMRWIPVDAGIQGP
jgi:hypothetical protein